MKLSQAAAFFDRTPALDPDTDEVLFRCQVDPYDDSKRDAGAAYRRVLSVKPGTVVPGVVRVFGDVWVVGRSERDGLSELHRAKYVLQPAAARASVSRLPDFLAGAATLASWVGVEWVKDGKELEVSSNIPQTYSIYAPIGLDMRTHDVVWYAGEAFLVMAVREQPSGYLIGSALRLDQPLPLTAEVLERVYDPVAGRFREPSQGTGIPLQPGVDDADAVQEVPALRVRWQSLFEYGSQADARYEEGDGTIVLPGSAIVSTASQIGLLGRRYRVLSCDTLPGVQVVHARPL